MWCHLSTVPRPISFEPSINVRVKYYGAVEYDASRAKRLQRISTRTRGSVFCNCSYRSIPWHRTCYATSEAMMQKEIHSVNQMFNFWRFSPPTDRFNVDAKLLLSLFVQTKHRRRVAACVNWCKQSERYQSLTYLVSIFFFDHSTSLSQQPSDKTEMFAVRLVRFSSETFRRLKVAS